jgi:aspartate kinase
VGIIVQKFGGTSVADAACIQRAAAKMVRAKEQGHQVVVTVSAQAGMTDKLIAMAGEISPDPDPREMDMLLSTGEQMSIALVCMTLHAMGHPAISLTGGQVGIVTDSVYTKARIRSVETSAIRRELDQGKIVVVAGFQGTDGDLNITTLGRGGSDLTAVALAAALGAAMCENYTDVDGVYTADPRVVPDASKLGAISHDEILELAGVGAKVLQSRSVEVAKKYRTPMCVRSTFTDDPGTVICSEVRGFTDVAVVGAALSLKEARLTIAGLPDTPGIAAKVVGAIGERDINIDMIIQSFPVAGKADMSFLVKHTDMRHARATCELLASELNADSVQAEENIARVSAVGSGMVAQPGIAAAMCSAIAEAGINVKMITTSEINISLVVDAEDGDEALRAVHRRFGLHALPPAEPEPERPGDGDGLEYETMEGLHVQGVECVGDQAELKVPDLPDQPGIAANVLTALAQAGVNIDVVLQNSCPSGISITTARSDVETARRAVESMDPRPNQQPLVVNEGIAKVIISGVGLRSHAGAASRVFGVLAREGINIQMIGTSEVKISVIVSEADAERAAALLSDEFGPVGRD